MEKQTTEDPAANGNDTTIDENIEKTSETKSEENKSDDADQIKSNAEETPITEEAEEMKPTVAIAESETLVTNGVGSSTEKVTPPAEAKEDIIPSVRSENVLEQQSAIEEAKVPEPIAVAETETPTVATNGSVELIENNGTVEVAKVLNGTTAESPKIEVKTENDENINNSVTSNKDTTATASEVVVPLVEPTTADDGGDVSKDVVEQQQQKQEPQQQQTEQIIATSDSDINSGAVIVEPIAQSSPPPPLPCSPPPSQVMVFALSDEESQVANSQTNQAPSESPVAAAATEAEISADAKLPATVDVEKPENDQPIELVEDHSPVAETKSSLEAEKESTGPLEASDAQANEQLVQSTQGKDVEEKEDKDAKENTEDDMSHGKGFPPTPVQFSSDNVEYSEAFLGVPDVDVITAQTIALIDEVTQEAATEVEKIIMIDESLGQPSPSLEERTLDDEKATQCNPPPTAELESQTSFSSTQLNSEQSENIPPPAADVVVPTTDTSPDSKVDQVEIEQKQIETSQHIDQLQDNTVTSLTEAPLEDNSNKPIDTTTIPETTTNDKLETPPSSSEIKENGIGDAHDQPIETSATESLNGSVEHKTIEEMKADHQIEKAPNDIVTQEAAVAVE